MNEEQDTTAPKAEDDTSKVFFGDSTLESAEEHEKNKDDDYYDVDKPKKEVISNIGDGEMRDEGTVGMGDLPEDNSLVPGEQTDEQDKAELRDMGN